jgi:F-type H+-transporting ATPase subunit b
VRLSTAAPQFITMVENILFIAATDASAGGGNPIFQIAENFGLDVRILFFQILNFGIVAFLLYRFAFKPILETIDQRQKEISDGLEFAEDAKAKLADSEKQHAATLQKAQQEAQAIAATARDNAKAFLDKQTQEASTKSEEMISKAKEAIELERKKMLTEVREEVTRLVVETTSKVLSKKLSADDKTRYNKTAAEELTSVGS